MNTRTKIASKSAVILLGCIWFGEWATATWRQNWVLESTQITLFLIGVAAVIFAIFGLCDESIK